MSAQIKFLIAVLGLTLVGCAGTAERTAWDRWDDVSQVMPQSTLDSENAEPMVPHSLPDAPGLSDLLAYAEANNPGLRATYHEWQAVLEGIPAARSLPDPRLGYAYMVQPIETRVGPQRQRVSLSQTLPWFGTTGLKGEMEAVRAQAVAATYDAERLRVRFEVRRQWAELYFWEQSLAITLANRDLMVSLEEVARRRYAAGQGPQDPLLRAQLELGRLEDRLGSVEDQRASLVAELNAVLGRNTTAQIAAPSSLTDPHLPGDDHLRAALGTTPHMEVYQHMAAREKRSSRLATRRGLPDLTVGAEFIDIGDARVSGVPDSGKNGFALTASVNLPLWRGSYNADRRGALIREQAVSDRGVEHLRSLEATLEGSLFARRDAMRRHALYRDTLIPKALQSLSVLERGFASGSTSFLDLVDTQRTLLEFELQMARARTDTFIQCARLMELTALDPAEVVQ